MGETGGEEMASVERTSQLTVEFQTYWMWSLKGKWCPTAF